jgi:FkbM family methyltransferase
VTKKQLLLRKLSFMAIPNIKSKIKSILMGLNNIASPDEVTQAENDFYNISLTEGMTAFDVGANIGEFTLLFANKVGESGQVHAFEPCINTFKKLQGKISSINLPQIIINNNAVSDKEEIIKLYVYDEAHSTLNSMADRPLEKYGLNIKSTHTEEIQAITIDSYCARMDVSHIDLLKIDVEGAEYQVLLGAEQMLKTRSIDCVLFEFGQTVFDMGNNPWQIKNYLNQVGYKINNIIRHNPIFPGANVPNEAKFSIHLATPRG